MERPLATQRLDVEPAIGGLPPVAPSRMLSVEEHRAVVLRVEALLRPLLGLDALKCASRIALVVQGILAGEEVPE